MYQSCRYSRCRRRSASSGPSALTALAPSTSSRNCGRCLSAARRDAIVEKARETGLPLVEDNPYGDLWFDQAPPAPLASRWAEGSIYLGSFSKVLAPGMRLGYVIAPPALMPKLLQAKQAADLHTPGFNQRVVHEVIRDGFLDEHVPTIRALYKQRRDAMRAALEAHLPPGCRWTVPTGGMFFWVSLPEGDFEAHVARLRLTYTLTPRMFVSGLTQYNSSDDVFSTNFGFRWEWSAGSELFIVYSEDRDTDPLMPDRTTELGNRGLVIKVNRLLQL